MITATAEEAARDLAELLERGEPVEIVRDGRSVGRLVPQDRAMEAYLDGLVAEGQLIPAKVPRGTYIPKPVSLPPGVSVLQGLLDDREEEFREGYR